MYSVAIQYLYTINGRYQVLGIPICYTEYVARRELRVRKSTVYLLLPKGQQKCSRWCFHDAWGLLASSMCTIWRHVDPFGGVIWWKGNAWKSLLKKSHAFLNGLLFESLLVLCSSEATWKHVTSWFLYSSMMLHESLKIIRVAHRSERNLSSWTCSTKVSTMGILFEWDERRSTEGCRMACWWNDNKRWRFTTYTYTYYMCVTVCDCMSHVYNLLALS